MITTLILWSPHLERAICHYLTAVIIVMQFTHYKSFPLIERLQFRAFHKQHTTALGWIAGFPMILDLLLASLLAWETKQGLWLINLGLALGLWLVTFFTSVPAHNHLAQGYDQMTWKRLMKSNKVRVVLCVIRSGLLLFSV
jgi:hypothetical protein